MARTNHVTWLHLTAKEAGKCSLAECPERKGKSFPVTGTKKNIYGLAYIFVERITLLKKKNRLYVEKQFNNCALQTEGHNEGVM